MKSKVKERVTNKMNKLQGLIDNIKSYLNKEVEHQQVSQKEQGADKLIVERENKTADMVRNLQKREESHRGSEFIKKRARTVQTSGQFRLNAKLETRLEKPSDEARFGGWAMPGYVVNYTGIHVDEQGRVWLEYKNNLKLKYVRVGDKLETEEINGEFILINPLSGDN